ncbi:MAG: radical SAM protein, partial [Candidatus Nanoarchaeia archaeon]|nr:radical SAM protein [Candidatus Nanoarchaeia archaeon]
MNNFKVLLITPPIFKEMYGVFAEAGGKNAPMGLLYLAAILKKNNIDVEILDAEGENLEVKEVIQKIKEIKPNLIGLTAATAAISKTILLATKIKEELKDIKVIIGGPHVTALPKETLENTIFDLGMIGEAEYTFLELVQALRDGKEYKKIKSLVYRDKNNKVVINPRRELIENLDELPLPAWELLKDFNIYTPQLTAYRKKPVGTIISSRGCPFQCIFCDRNIFGNKFRARSAKNVLEEVDYLIKNYKVKEIKFIDDTFTINKQRVLDICKLLMERKYNLIWSCSIRADTVDKELLTTMKKAGCWFVSLGVESGNEKVLRDIKKNLTKDQIRNACKLAKEAGLKTRGFFIIGHPTDTKETIRETIDFAKE